MNEEIKRLLDNADNTVQYGAMPAPTIRHLIEVKEILSEEILRLERIDHKVTTALASCMSGNHAEHVKEKINNVKEVI